MDRINQIIQHHKYRCCLQLIRELEAERAFCGHDMTHFLDVARLAYLFNLEQQLNIPKEEIYAAALLHDIGRHIEYLEGIPHQESSIPIAEEILCDCGFAETKIRRILDAIKEHRNPLMKEHKDLSGLIYCADKMSRSCFGCKAEKECRWSKEKKNLTLQY